MIQKNQSQLNQSHSAENHKNQSQKFLIDNSISEKNQSLIT